MFQTLTSNLTKIFDRIKGTGVLTEAHIDSAMRDIRVALLEADVALPVVRTFIQEVSVKAKGTEVIKSVSPAQMVIKIINDEMIRLLEPAQTEAKLNLQSVPPVNLLFVGLQGSGKTTASAKLAFKLKKQGKKVLLVSLDTYRPAAQEQLAILGKSAEVDSLDIVPGEMPIDITERALSVAKLSGYDVVIYDTAGRLHIDDEMIDEVVKIRQMINPAETFLVIDSMIGQDAVNVATIFNQKLDISGLILSRIDGDAKGGAALSARYVTGKPIKFLSSGEKLDTLEEFDAKRIASRILDMGDVVAFVEKAADVIDRQIAEKTAARLKKGKFDIDDYVTQIKMIKKMGGMGSMMSFLPGINKLQGKLKDISSGDELLSKQVAIASSMTKKERKDPSILNASRRKRIAAGSGTSVQQVNTFLGQYQKISSALRRMSRMDPKTLMRSGIGKLFS